MAIGYNVLAVTGAWSDPVWMLPAVAIAPGDLLFFHSEHGSHISHVAFAAENDSLIHSTIACGGVVEEPFTPGSRAGTALRPRLVAARRIAGRS